MKQLVLFLVALFLSGCAVDQHIKTDVLTDTCIKPLYGYHYSTCSRIVFTVNDEEFYIPAHFETDLASIPRFMWPLMAPSHSSLMRAAIIHDWFYRMTCDFTRFQTDLIFYHMLRNDGVSPWRASMMYYAVRMFGWRFYKEDYCEHEFKGLDQETRRVQIASIFRHSRESDDRLRQ